MIAYSLILKWIVVWLESNLGNNINSRMSKAKAKKAELL
jgi:hypothetical protein